MEKCVAIKVSGRVQGVGFRYHTRNVALELGVRGFVVNLPDGSVYIEALAEETILDTFIQWCRTGPRHALVEECLITGLDVQGYSSFEVKRPFE